MNILFEDKEIIVVVKPAGVPTEGGKVGEKDMVSLIKKYLKDKGEEPAAFVIHRLDQPVSGILVFAKTKEAAAFLSSELSKDSFSKDYKALVYKSQGFKEKGHLENYLLKDSKTNTSKVVDSAIKGAKKAILDYELLEEKEDCAEVLVHLMTGRHHQIRVQMANAGMPLLGDQKYGTKESAGVSLRNGIENVALTAYKLSFRHPRTKEKLTYEI